MRTSLALVSGSLIAAVVASSAAASTVPDINGGASWNGWTSAGQSDQVGVWGATGGGNGTVYEIYQTVFRFNPYQNGATLGAGYQGGTTPSNGTGWPFGFGSNTRPINPNQPSPNQNPGFFAFDNLIYGVGIRRVSGTGTMGTQTISFDIGNDSYAAASTVGGSDGRVSTGTYSQTGDLNYQASSSYNGSSLGLQLGTGSFYGGPSNFQSYLSNAGADFALRAFGNGFNAQYFFDITAMNLYYSQTGASAISPTAWGSTRMGLIGSQIRLSIDLGGMGSRTFLQSMTLSAPNLIPAPGAIALLGLSGLARGRRRQS